MKKAKFFITMLLSLVMALSLALFTACNPFEDPIDSTTPGESTLPGESTTPGESTPVEDETAPVITIAGGVTTLTVGLGEELTIPAATATDDVDGEVEVITYSETPNALNENVFKLNILGKHVVTYYACDEAENETYLDVTVEVTSEQYAETFELFQFLFARLKNLL